MTDGNAAPPSQEPPTNAAGAESAPPTTATESATAAQPPAPPAAEATKVEVPPVAPSTLGMAKSATIPGAFAVVRRERETSGYSTSRMVEHVVLDGITEADLEQMGKDLNSLEHT